MTQNSRVENTHRSRRTSLGSPLPPKILAPPCLQGQPHGAVNPPMTRGCPFLAAAAARTAEPGSGSAAALFDSATCLDEALHVVHGPHGPLPLPSSAPEVASSWPPTSCPFLAAQARRAQACEADGEECSAPAQECAPEPGRGWSASAAEKEALQRLAAAPFARIAFPSGFGTTPLTPVRAPGDELHSHSSSACGERGDGLLCPRVLVLTLPTAPPTAVWRHARAVESQGSAPGSSASRSEQRRGEPPELSSLTAAGGATYAPFTTPGERLVPHAPRARLRARPETVSGV